MDNGLSISRIWSYWLIVNDKKKCTALLSIRWEARSTSDHAMRRSAQHFYDDGREWCYPLMSHHSGFFWWMGKSLWSGAVFDYMGSCVGDAGSRDCGSMWVHGFICPKVHIHNSIATVMTDIFQKIWFQMPRKLAKILQIFDKTDDLNDWGVT